MRRASLFLSTLLCLATLVPTGGVRAQTTLPPCPDPRPAPVDARLRPAMPCADRDVALVLSYAPCCRTITSVDAPAAGHGWVVHVVDTSDDTCSNARCAPDSLVVPLGRFLVGHYELTVHFVTEWRSQIESCVTEEDRRFSFDVTSECTPPTGIPYLDWIEIGHGGQACPGDSIPVRFSGTVPGNCTQFAGVEVIPSPVLAGPIAEPPSLRLVFLTNSALGAPCIVSPVPWSASLNIGPLMPRDWRLAVGALLIDVGPQPPDSTLLGAASFPFTVLDTCTIKPSGCLLPGWAHPNAGDCDAFIGPDHEAQLTFEVGTTTPLAALQGSIVMNPLGLHITGVEPVGAAAGMHLSWNQVPEGVKFVLLDTDGTPIPAAPPFDPVPVLRLTFATDPVAPPAPRTRVFPGALLGADVLGQAVYLCPTFAPIDASAYICRGAPCDFNGDGYVDVRDLVRMVRCVNGTDPCDPAYTATFDCNGDGAFDLDDVLCCALAILGRTPTPGGGQARDAALHVTMASPEMVDGAVEIPVEIAGDAPLGAARLELGVPTASFAAIDVRTEAGAPWLAVHESGAGTVTVGLIALQPGAGSDAPVRFTLRLTPAAGTTPSGEVTLVGADFAAADGARLVTDPGDPIVVLGDAGHVRLTPARPNPFSASQHISLVVPKRAEVELVVFDLGGRRLRTLQSGVLDAGAHGFTWDGRDDAGRRLPGGVYFYRARVDGVDAARRVVLLGAPR